MDIFSIQNQKSIEKPSENNNSDSIKEQQKKENLGQNDQLRQNSNEQLYFEVQEESVGLVITYTKMERIIQYYMFLNPPLGCSLYGEVRKGIHQQTRIILQDDKFLYIFTELCTGGDLFEKIRQEGSLSEKKVAEIMKQILSTVTYCHQQNIVLRDIQPEKILYESEQRKFIIKIF